MTALITSAASVVCFGTILFRKDNNISVPCFTSACWFPWEKNIGAFWSGFNGKSLDSCNLCDRYLLDIIYQTIFCDVLLMLQWSWTLKLSVRNISLFSLRWFYLQRVSNSNFNRHRYGPFLRKKTIFASKTDIRKVYFHGKKLPSYIDETTSMRRRLNQSLKKATRAAIIGSWRRESQGIWNFWKVFIIDSWVSVGLFMMTGQDQ